MLPLWFIIIAIVLRLFGGAAYVRAVIVGKARPNPITWFFWGLTPMVAFAAQVAVGVGWEAWMTFVLGVGPLVVCVLALVKDWSASHFTASNLTCAVLAVLGILLWQLTDNPVLAIVFSILADVFASVPTVIKAYRRPASEYAPAYFLSMVSMLVTLLTVQNWQFASFAFPAYIFFINFLIFTLAKRRIPQLKLEGS